VVTAGNTTNANFSLVGQSRISYTYDRLGRLIGVSDSLSDTAKYAYDAVGNLTSITRNASSTTSIIGFTPVQALVGATVIISGTGFSSTPSENTVQFNGTTAAVSSATATQLVVTVPAGATTGALSVTSPGGSANSASAFTVLSDAGLPTITSFTPAIGPASTAVTITGTHFDTVALNNRIGLNQSLTPVLSATTTSLSTTIPDKAMSGRFKVTTRAGQAVSTSDFFIVPAGYTTGQVSFTGRATVGGSLPVTIGAATIGLVLFDGTAGQQVSLFNSNSTLGGCRISLSMFTPAGDMQVNPPACFGNLWGIASQTLPATGTYTLLFSSSDAGSFNLNVQNVSTTVFAATLGSGVNVSMPTPHQVQQVVFVGTAGQRVSFQVTNFTLEGNQVTGWLAAPDGTVIWPNQDLRGLFADPVTLPLSGTYRFYIDPGLHTGSLTVTFYNVPPDYTGTITPGGPPVTVNLTAPGQNGKLTFSATTGQQLSVQMTGITISSSAVSIQYPMLGPLTANQQYDIRMEYFQGCCGSAAKLKWSSPSTLKQIIAQSQLTPPGGAAGTGLQGDYYSNTTLSGSPTLTRTDSVVDFTLNGSSPGGSVPSDNWSARWTGQVKAQYSEQYTLCTSTDDGARLWVNGILIVDHWVPQVETEWCSTTPLDLIAPQNFGTGTGSINTFTIPAAGTYTIFINPQGPATGSMTLTLNNQ